MKLEQYAKDVGLLGAKELEKVKLLAFYFHKTAGLLAFSLEDVVGWFDKLHLHAPNTSRLRNGISQDPSFVRSKDQDSWRLHAGTLDELQAAYPGLTSESEEVLSSDALLPRPIYESTRGFIESLARQINASFEYNIFDGCAVLMRRLLEVLLILSYEHLGIEGQIQDSGGNYMPLEQVVANAKTNSKLRLSRDSKVVVDEFRTLGNFAAHKIYFNCRRGDIRGIASSYRATIEELLYKAGIKS